MRHYDDMKLEDLALVTDGNKMHRFIELAEKGHGICLVSRALNEKLCELKTNETKVK
jgi:hypothetical protein